MSDFRLQIPVLDPPWPATQKIAVVTMWEAPVGWHRLAHQVETLAQFGNPDDIGWDQSPSESERNETVFLHRHDDVASGYLRLRSQAVTGHRSRSAGYRPATQSERSIRPCIMLVWVAMELRRRGVARKLVEAAAHHARVTPQNLAWAEPFTDGGYRLAQAITPGDLWIADYD